jgi:DNA-binding NarL/FixJ family response regulator
MIRCIEKTPIKAYTLKMSAQTRLLIADDSDSVRGAIRALLEREPGIAITGEARDYPELVRMLNKSIQDVVLMDVHMPGEDGFNPVLVKAQLRGSSLLAMSLWNDEETTGLALTYGAIKLLDKANLASLLMPAIKECTRQ